MTAEPVLLPNIDRILTSEGQLIDDSIGELLDEAMEQRTRPSPDSASVQSDVHDLEFSFPRIQGISVDRLNLRPLRWVAVAPS